MSTPTRESANGKPAPGTPVIRAGTFDDREPPMWKRLLPAFVISGGFHVILVAFGVLLFLGVKPAPANTKVEQVLDTKIEESKEKEEDLINPEVGLDPTQELSNDSERMEEVTVNGETAPEQPIGDPTAEVATPETSDGPMGDFNGDGAAASDIGEAGGMVSENVGGKGGRNKLSFRGNSAARAALTTEQGGNGESEAAVARGLIWLARQQQKEGYWRVEGEPKWDVAATGIALLPFLAAGETHKTGKKYSTHVLKGITWLLSRQTAAGDFTGAGNMYGNAIATVALCEAYGMTQDGRLQAKAQAALNYLVRAQAANGSWGYSAGTAGDTSIVGWQVQALKSGVMANLSVPSESFRKAGQFLDSVMDSQGTYGYTSKGGTPNLTAVGALCRQYMGWGPKNVNLQKSVEYLKARAEPGKTRVGMYCWYYATQVMHFYGGPDWKEFWNPKMRDLLIKTQEKGPGKNDGSWDDKGEVAFGHGGGRHFTTCTCLLTLEVYYRHLPLYRRDGEGLKELEG